jgi:hypothetical protein
VPGPPPAPDRAPTVAGSQEALTGDRLLIIAEYVAHVGKELHESRAEVLGSPVAAPSRPQPQKRQQASDHPEQKPWTYLRTHPSEPTESELTYAAGLRLLRTMPPSRA